MMFFRFSFGVAVLVAATFAQAEPAAPRLLAEKSQIAFVTKQMGVPVEGTFGRFGARVAFNPHKPEGGGVALYKALGGGRFEIAGQLTIKGQVQDLVVPVTITQGSGHSVASGSFTIQRLAFKVGDGEWADTSIVGNDVQVRFKLMLAGLGPL